MDSRIVAILSANGRESFSAIGREVGLSTNAVAARIRRLEASGVIAGYRAILGEQAEASTGPIEAFIDVRLQADHDSEEFLAWARQQSSVLDAAHVTGPYDYYLHVRVGDTGALNEFLRSLKKSAGAAQTQTRLALR